MQFKYFYREWMNEGKWTNALVTVWVTSCVRVGSHFIMTRTHFSVKETETQRGEDRAQDIQQRSLGLLFLKCVCPSTLVIAPAPLLVSLSLFL